MNRHAPRRRVLSVLCGLFVLFSVPFALRGTCVYGLARVVYLDDANAVERLKADFEATVPAGSSPEQAEAWVKAQGLTRYRGRGPDLRKLARIGEIRVHVKYAHGKVEGIAVWHEPVPEIGGE